jgi:hypothetical protein
MAALAQGYVHKDPPTAGLGLYPGSGPAGAFVVAYSRGDLSGTVCWSDSRHQSNNKNNRK